MGEVYELQDEGATRTLGASLAARLHTGDVVFLYGELGAGKTTLVRGLLESLGFTGAVRSPTFNLVQTFDTSPPVLHADLYRVDSYRGIGLEDYLDSHLCLVEWPEAASGLVPPGSEWIVKIEFAGSGRIATVTPPAK